MAAEIGNEYASKGRKVEKLINRALVQEDDKRLRQGVEKLLDAVADGERWALEFITDRLDGKATQPTTIGNLDGSPIFSSEVLELVRPK